MTLREGKGASKNDFKKRHVCSHTYHIYSFMCNYEYIKISLPDLKKKKKSNKLREAST